MELKIPIQIKFIIMYFMKFLNFIIFQFLFIRIFKNYGRKRYSIAIRGFIVPFSGFFGVEQKHITFFNLNIFTSPLSDEDMIEFLENICPKINIQKGPYGYVVNYKSTWITLESCYNALLIQELSKNLGHTIS